MQEYSGACLCGYITYRSKGEAISPHLCSCRMCQKWSGAPTVAWVGFPLKNFTWDGAGGAPTFYRSSEKVQRGFCPKCGSALCALEKEIPHIFITLATLLEPNLIVPGSQHSYKEEAPAWWAVEIVANPKG